jgi:hypothetical protein
MLKKSWMIRLLIIFAVTTFVAGNIRAQVASSANSIPPIPETAQYDIDLADIYAELFPDKNEAFVICTIWLSATFDPVILRLEGNLMHMNVTSKSQPAISFVYEKPYIYLDNLEPGAQQVTFTYRVRHDGITSAGLISNNDLRLDAASWWYPRNVALDAHQAILNIESPQNYAVSANATIYKNVDNNFKQLRQFILTTASTDGITLD